MKRKKPLKIETVPVEALVPYADNPRINEDAIPKVKASFRKYGVINPLIINADNVILCGHTRLAAAKELGLSELPCVRVTHLTPEQERAYRLADNKTAEFSMWDFPKLEVELGALTDAGFDMGDIGFPSAFSVDAGDAPLEDYSIGGEPGEGEGEGAGQSFRIVYEIAFDDEAQQSRWFEFLRRLKAAYPDEETISARIIAAVDEWERDHAE